MWSVGHTESLSFNFCGIGDEADKEIQTDGNLLSKYAVDTMQNSEGEWIEREVPYTIAEQIYVHSFMVEDNGTMVTINDTTNASKKLSDGTTYGEMVAKRNTNDKGVPYAQHYTLEGWGDDGMSVRIPPYYELQEEDTDSIDPSYIWEKWVYTMIGHREGAEDFSSSNGYIIWGTRSDDVHYRITHET